MSDERHQTVIVGAGFAGLTTAIELGKRSRRFQKNNKTTILDKRAGQVYYPLLYEVATGGLHDGDYISVDDLEDGVLLPFDKSLHIHQKAHTDFQSGEVVGIDIDQYAVELRDGEIISYDTLVFAVGSQTATYGIPGVKTHAICLKSLDDALRIRKKLRALTKKQNGTPSVIVVGGGATGTEFAAELANCMDDAKCSSGAKDPFSITLIEASASILSFCDEKIRLRAKKRLQSLGVEIMEDTRVEKVLADGVMAKKKEGNEQKIESDIVVWTGGTKPVSLAQDAGLPTDERGFIKVQPTMQVEGLDDVFAIGDCAFFKHPNTQKRVPALAQSAIKEAGIAAENITRRFEHRPLINWTPPKHWDTIIPLGGKYAIADLAWWNLYGWAGYVLRKIVDLLYFTSVLPLKDAIEVWWRGALAFIRND